MYYVWGSQRIWNPATAREVQVFMPSCEKRGVVVWNVDGQEDGSYQGREANFW